MGLAASSPWIDAQTTRGLVPEQTPGNAASVQIAPANPAAGSSRKPTAGPAIDPGEAAMLRSRSVRTVLRNGLDYIKYQQFDRALAYLREAERRKQELNSQEQISLRQGIDAAQEGLRAPSNASTYAKARKPQAGSISIAARSAQKAPLDTAMLPASNEVPAAQPAAKTKDTLAALEPIAPEVLAKSLPSAADLARSRSIASARQQYAAVGNGGDSQPLPPVTAPKAASADEPAQEPAAPAEKLSPATSLPPLTSPTSPAASDSQPAPLPGSPVARATMPEAAPPALDNQVAAANESLTPPPTAHEAAPALPKLSVPAAPPEEAEAPAEKPAAVEAAAKPAAPVVETPSLPPLEPAEQPAPAPATLKPTVQQVPDEAPAALPELPQASPAPKPAEEPAPTPTPAEPKAAVEVAAEEAPKALPVLEAAEAALPPLPSANDKPAPTAPRAAEMEVKPARAELAAEEAAPPASAKPAQEVGGIPVLTPLADDDEPAAAPKAAMAKPLAAEEPSLPPLPDAPAALKPEAEPSLPPLPTAPAVKEEAPAVKQETPAVTPEAPAAEPVKLAEKPAAEPSLPPLPVAPAVKDEAPAAEPPAKPEAAPAAEPGLPPLPVVTDTPPVPTAPAAEPAPERVALKEAAAPAATDDSLPPLPAEEVAPSVAASAPAPGSGDTVELGKISDRFLGGLTAERRREIEQMARNQVERGGGATPGLSPLGTQPPDEAGAIGRPAVPGSNTSISATDDPLVRLELPRAPSPAEARPIRAILLPEQFDNIKQRQFNPRRKMWASAATAHYPLYFQDPSLERYGISIEQRMGTAGRKLTYPIDDPKESKLRNQIASPFVSSGLFAVQIMTWPFRAIADPPWESEYDLGYYRPGDKVPEDTVIVPWKGVGPLFKGNRY